MAAYLPPARPHGLGQERVVLSVRFSHHRHSESPPIGAVRFLRPQRTHYRLPRARRLDVSCKKTFSNLAWSFAGNS
jgi:hypothetical protein